MEIWLLELELITAGSKICIWQMIDFSIHLELILTGYILEIHEKSNKDNNNNSNNNNDWIKRWRGVAQALLVI